MFMFWPDLSRMGLANCSTEGLIVNILALQAVVCVAALPFCLHSLKAVIDNAKNGHDCVPGRLYGNRQ